MKGLVGIISCVIATLTYASADYESYTGYQVLRTNILDENGVKKLLPLLHDANYDFWIEPHVGRFADIMVSPSHIRGLEYKLQTLGFNFQVLIADVGEVIAKERSQIESLRKAERLLGKAPDLSRYLELDEINAYIDSVVDQYPSIASVIEIGTSYEGRAIRVLKLSNGAGKSGMFMEAGIHAREWMGQPVILYSINELTENIANNQAMLDSNDFYFLPVANPDGYVYTWNTNRFWRKTRSPNDIPTCEGSDASRNFDWNWAGGEFLSACDDAYPGSAVFSESEARAIADFLTANTQITLYLSIHSYGQFLMHPWGDTFENAPNVDSLDQLAKAATEALFQVRGTVYNVGSTSNVLFTTYGSDIDWALGKQNIMFPYTLELPSGGDLGFDPPVEDISPVTRETWEAIKVFAAYIPATRGKK